MPVPDASTQRRSIFWLLVLIDVALWGTAFTWRGPEIGAAPAVAVSIWPGTETQIAARNSGVLPLDTINFVEMSWSSSMMRAFANHAVDVAYLSLSEALLQRDIGVAFRVAMVVDESTGADAIVARPGIDQISGLKGKKIGVEVRSAGHYLLARALRDSGLTLGDVRVVPLILPETETAFEELGVDAVATAEPWLTRIVANGHHVLYDSTQTPGEMLRVMVVREEAMETHAESLRQLVRAHFDGMDPASWSAGIATGIRRREGLSESEFEAAFGRLEPFGREDQLGWLSGPEAALTSRFAVVHRHLIAAGLISEGVPAEIPLDVRLVQP